jgi:hypothetical protein
MNENITIKEGNISRRLAPIDKLKVNTTDNKDSMWVPTGNANTGVLHASENGIYIASEDGYEAYSEVIVRVTKDSYEGDTSFDDWDYETPDMDIENWDPETIEEFENDPEGFDDVFNNEDEWKDINKPIDTKFKDDKISGIDPFDGNKYAVGLDTSGFLTKELMPSSIKIITPPSKLKYVNGEHISIEGIVVQAYTEDGNVWSNDRYPNGIIPIDELIFNPLTAFADIPSIINYNGDASFSFRNISQTMYVSSGNAKCIGGFYQSVKTGDTNNAEYLVTIIVRFVWASYEPFSITTTIRYGDEEESKTSDATGATAGDVSYFYRFIQSTSGFTVSKMEEATASVSPSGGVPVEYNDNFTVGDAENLAFSVLGDKIEAKMTVTVSWIMPDDFVAEDSYEITVVPKHGSVPQHEESPRAITYNGTRYLANEDVYAEAHYASGTVWNRNTGAIYNVRDAVALGMLVPADEGDTETSS